MSQSVRLRRNFRPKADQEPFSEYYLGPPTRQPALAVVVNYNSGDRLEALLEALEREVRQVIVVDNASSDGSQDPARNRERTTLLQNERNRGFAAAVNQGAKHGAAEEDEWVVLVNDDAHVRPGEITELLSNLPPDVAVVAPMQVDSRNAPLSESGGYDPSIVRYLVWAFLPGRFHYRFGPHISRPFPRGDTELDWVSAAMMGIRTGPFFELGMLDEKYWMYVEDIDFCRRVRQAGYRVILRESVHLIHEVAHGDPQRRILSGLRSMESLALEFHGWQRRAFGVAMGIGYVLRATVAGSSTERALARASIRHCAELIKGRFPDRDLPNDADPGRSMGALEEQ
jgi:GT2 family glycosyltransferase